jgi:hypothetical protein
MSIKATISHFPDWKNLKGRQFKCWGCRITVGGSKNDRTL